VILGHAEVKAAAAWPYRLPDRAIEIDEAAVRRSNNVQIQKYCTGGGTRPPSGGQLSATRLRSIVIISAAVISARREATAGEIRF
jgi:hypothetical protein